MGYNLLTNGVYWGYNPLTNHLLTSWDIQVDDTPVISFKLTCVKANHFFPAAYHQNGGFFSWLRLCWCTRRVNNFCRKNTTRVIPLINSLLTGMILQAGAWCWKPSCGLESSSHPLGYESGVRWCLRRVSAQLGEVVGRNICQSDQEQGLPRKEPVQL